VHSLGQKGNLSRVLPLGRKLGVQLLPREESNAAALTFGQMGPIREEEISDVALWASSADDDASASRRSSHAQG
jgi:hypothetical protein